MTLAVDGYAPAKPSSSTHPQRHAGCVYEAGVEIVTNARLYGADDDTVYLQNTLTSQPVIAEDVAARCCASATSRRTGCFTS